MADKAAVDVSSCGYCSKKVDLKGIKSVKCIVCNKGYHLSCSQRIKTVEMVNQEHGEINCCGGTEMVSQDAGDRCESVQLENLYLKKLLEEKEARIQELIKLNKTLEEKIELMNFININIKSINSIQTSDKVPTYASKTVEKKEVKITDKKQAIPITTDSEKNVNKPKEVTLNKYINMVSDIPNVPGNAVQSHDGYTMVARKKVRSVRRDEVKGSGPQNEEGFVGKPRKFWYFVGRASDTVDESKISNYIKRKCCITKNDDLVVNKLNLESQRNAFQVGIDSKYNDMINNADFWPEGIVVRRFFFNFKKKRNENEGFLDQKTLG